MLVKLDGFTEEADPDFGGLNNAGQAKKTQDARDNVIDGLERRWLGSSNRVRHDGTPRALNITQRTPGRRCIGTGIQKAVPPWRAEVSGSAV